MPSLTPFSTVGPFFRLLIRDRAAGADCLASDATRGERIRITGRLLDGNGAGVDDGLVEIWQADSAGRYPPPEGSQDGAADPAFTGFGRAATAPGGAFSFQTVKPGAVKGPDGRIQAPHILVSVMGRGVMSRCWTRLYFDGDALNETDQVLQLVPHDRRGTLIACRREEGAYEFNIVLQGEGETVFFDA